jgi:preprotein translocase subunit SecG
VGIEAMQMLIVAAILPSLMLMSRTRAYSLLRIGGALFAGAASLGWIVERLFDIETPVDTIVNVLARHALWIAAGFFVLSLVSRLLPGSRAQQTAHMNRATGLPITPPFFKALDR